MRSLKKVLALLTVIAMIFSTTAAFGKTFEDVEGTDYEEAVVTLSSLNVLNGYEDGTFKPEGDITRAEFAKVVIAVMNMTASAGQTATSFEDVAADNWASGFIKLAEQMKIVNGYGNGKFGPQDNVTYEQAIKMIVAALGFSPKAEALGGYPTGYMVVAAQEGITKGIRADASKAASRGVVAQLVYNALEVKMMEQTGFGNDVTFAVPTNAKTLLADYLEVTKYENAKITANEYTGLSSSSSSARTKEDQVKAVDEANANIGTLKTNGTNAAQLLGYVVDIYVNDDDEIVSINKSKDKNNEFVVLADVIEGYDDNNNILEYEDEDDEIEELDIASNAKVIVNGLATDMDEFETLMNVGFEGKLTLVDTQDGDIYDLLLITATENKIVDDVLAARDRIDFKDGSTLTLDPDDKDYKFVILLDDEEIEVKDLEEWDVVSIAGDEDDGLIMLYVSRETVEGMISEEEDSGEKKYIGGKSYKVANNITSLGASDFTLGAEGTFYLDIYGKIAGYDTESETGNYAFVIAAGEGSSIDTSYEFKLLTSNNDETVYKLASRVKYGSSTRKAEDVIADLVEDVDGLDDEDGLKVLNAFLITYELNSSGEINEIKIPSADGAEDTLKYDEDDMSLGGSFFIDKDTVIFDISEYDLDPTKDIEAKGVNYFVDSDSYKVIPYEIEDAIAKVVVVTMSASSGRMGSNIALVDRITQTKNSDDETVFRLRALVGGEEKQILTSDDLGASKYDDSIDFDDLGRGDIISYKVDASGAINEFMVLFTASIYSLPSQAIMDEMMEDDEDLDVLMVGEVTEKQTRAIRVDGNYYTTLSADVYEYDESRDRVTVEDRGDIVRSDYVFILQYDGKVSTIVILDDYDVEE